MNDLLAGKLIRRLRRERNMTMVNFAKQIGLSQPTLSRIESGNQEITFSVLGKICKALNISLGDFIYELEGKSMLQDFEKDKENLDIEEKLDNELVRMISSLSIEQKKALYALFQPYIEE